MSLYKTNDTRYMSDEEIRQRRLEGYKRNPFTPRQHGIIEGTVSNVRLNEINVLIKKCEAKGNPLLATMIYEKYEDLITGETKAKYTLKKAKEILQSLTPWKIIWGDEDFPLKVKKEK